MSYFVKISFLAIAIAASEDSKRTITFKNNCPKPMWLKAFPEAMNMLTFPSEPGPLPTLSIAAGETKSHKITEDGWGGTFVPNFGCDENGNNCTIGGSYTTNFDGKPFSYPKNGNTQIRFWFTGPLYTDGYWNYSTYSIDISNGFYTPVRIVPKITGAMSCQPMEFSGFPCPTNETLVDAGTSSATFVNVSLASANPLQCLSPCAYIYGPDGPVHKYSVDSSDTTYYKKKGVAYKLGPDNYCCNVADANCKVRDTEYYRALLGASGKAANLDAPFYNPPDQCFESWSTSYDVTISCPDYNKAPQNPPSCD